MHQDSRYHNGKLNVGHETTILNKHNLSSNYKLQQIHGWTNSPVS